MGASCAVWASALAALKQATRNAKNSARIVSLATKSRPDHKRSRNNAANQEAVSRSPSLGRISPPSALRTTALRSPAGQRP